MDFGMNISFGMTRCHFETDTNFHPKQTKTQLFSSKTNQDTWLFSFKTNQDIWLFTSKTNQDTWSFLSKTNLDT